MQQKHEVYTPCFGIYSERRAIDPDCLLQHISVLARESVREVQCMSEMSAKPKVLNLEASPRQGMSHCRTVSREPMGSVAAPHNSVLAGLCIT